MEIKISSKQLKRFAKWNQQRVHDHIHHFLTNLSQSQTLEKLVDSEMMSSYCWMTPTLIPDESPRLFTTELMTVLVKSNRGKFLARAWTFGEIFKMLPKKIYYKDVVYGLKIDAANATIGYKGKSLITFKDSSLIEASANLYVWLHSKGYFE